jgi:putative DNA primase/helicase
MKTPGTNNGTSNDEDPNIFNGDNAPDESEEPVDQQPTPEAEDSAAVLHDLLDYFRERSDAAASQNFILTEVTRAYLDHVQALQAHQRPTPAMLEQKLLTFVNAITDRENRKMLRSETKYARIRRLSAWQIAQILLRLHQVIRISPSSENTDREYDLLAMYEHEGNQRGTYTASEDAIRTTARLYNAQLSLADFKEVQAVLREDSQRKQQCSHRDLIAVNNGVVYYGCKDQDITIDGKVFHFTAKDIHPFDPALVFLQKAHVDYVVDAPNPVITHPTDGTVWDVESWVSELSDDPGVPDLIWEIISAIIRPHVRWGKTAWFYSEKGNNGKGTLCALMRNLVGSGAHTSIPLSDFGKDFALEPLVRANAIIVDENDVGTFIDKAANLKAIVTNDVIQINRKYRAPMAFQFFGFMVQCLNEFPRVKDKSESFYRRQLFVPFTKWFGSNERRYIKNDYLARRDVLEYVLWFAINRAGADDPGNFYRLSEPPATQEVLNEYKGVNDPIRTFWDEFKDQFVWDLLPFPFLYSLYKKWFSSVSPSGSPVSRQQFVAGLVGLVDDDTEWICQDKNRKLRPAQMISVPEPLIGEYDLQEWTNPSFKGTRTDQQYLPVLKPSYRGLLRRIPTGSVSGQEPIDHD